jgi:hypothetical protein
MNDSNNLVIFNDDVMKSLRSVEIVKIHVNLKPITVG